MRAWSRLTAFLGCAVVAFGSVAAAQPTWAQRDALVALTEVADIEGLALSPDGRKLAFRVQRPSVARNTYAIDWYVADLANGRITPVGDGGEVIYDNGLIEFEAPVWSPDGRAFFRRALVGGRIGVWRTAADGSGSVEIVAGEADVESIAAAPDGRSLTYVTGPTRAEIEAAERAEYDDGILIDATIDTRQGLYRAAYSHGRLATQRLMGHWYSRAGLLWRAPRTRHHLDLATLRERASEPASAATLPTAPAVDTISAVGPTGVVAEAATASGEPPRLSILAPDGNRTDCRGASCASGRVVAIAWRPGRQQVVVTRQEMGFRQTLSVFDAATGRLRDVADGEGLLSGGRSEFAPCGVSEHYAMCVTASAASPPRIERIELDIGRRTVVFDPNRELREQRTPTVEQIAVPYGDGRDASLVLLTPSHRPKERLPLFVMYYHCPGYLRGGMGDEYPFGPMVDAGFAVACITYGPMKPGETAVDNYESAQTTVEAVVRLLDRRGLIDTRRIGMGGLSFGSEVTMWMAMKTSLLAAAAIASPQAGPSGYWQTAIRGRDAPDQYRTFWKAGSPDTDLDAWRRISPELNTDRIKAPLLMQLPEQEIVSTLQFYARMTNTPTPVELYAYPQESHTKLQPRHRFAVYRRNLDWFRYWLQGYRDPDPAIAAQYSRWDDLSARRDLK